MRRMRWKQVCIVICLIAVSRVVTAEDSANRVSADVPIYSGQSPTVRTTELGIWGGYSGSNPIFVGRTTDRSLFMLNLQYARTFRASDTWAMKYTAEIIPVVYVKQPHQVVINGNPIDLPGGKQKIYGAGVTPVGLQVNFRPGSILQPYINGSAGILYFTDDVPVANSSRFNFNLGVGAGFQIWITKNQSIRLGYRYNHISNGYTAAQNPGMDSNLFYAGYSLCLKQ